MSATTPRPTPRRRSLETILELPPIRDVHRPGWIARRPAWLVVSVAVVILLALGGYLHSRQLSGELWFNEAIATGLATHSFPTLLHDARNGGSSPLYYVLLHVWINGFGDGARATHALSLLLGLLAIPIAAWIAWSLSGPRAAVYAAVLFAFSSYEIRYSQETQPYALLMLLGLLAIGGFLNGLVHRRRRWLWLLAIALAAALYTQASAALFWAGLLAATGIVAWLAEPADRGAILRDGALCFGAALVVYLPWLPSTIHQIGHATSPWHYTPLIGADIPSGVMGGERVDATLLVVVIVGGAPLLRTAAHRRSPEAVSLCALVVISVVGLAIAKLSQTVTPGWVDRYFAPMVAALLLLSALTAGRARIVGLAAIILIVAFNFDPGSFAAAHKSDMQDISGEVSALLHRGDVVAVAQPEQVPLADYYLAGGLRYWSTLGRVSDPTVMNWNDAQARLANARPAATLGPLVASLKPGQQLLYVRPLTEGVQDWKAPWTKLVRRRSAQWGQILTNDVANGTLTVVTRAPHSYPSACCVASSAILYRKT